MNGYKIKNGIKKLLRNDIKKKNADYQKKIKKYAFSGTWCIDEKQYEAVITRWYHTIEKGLAYVDYRPGFGMRNIEALMTSLENYIKQGYSTESFCYSTALSTLNEYIKKNREYGWEDKELEKRVQSLNGISNTWGGALKFEPISATEIKKVDYETFFKSRHSLRHFSEESVCMEKITSAISLAQYTPSACNRQPWKCYVIENKNIIQQVLKNQNGNEGFGHEFDKLLLITSDLRCFNADRELYQAFIDGGMYAQSVLNSLHFEHIASVPLSASLNMKQENVIRQLLKIHDAEVFVIFIGVGNYPKDCQSTKSARRKPNLEIIY